jgi:hypothetical protein
MVSRPYWWAAVRPSYCVIWMPISTMGLLRTLLMLATAAMVW